MKKERGVTLVTLAITITVLIIIASVATYSGIEIINSSRQTKFTAELKIMQVQINSIYQKYKENNPIVINGTTYYGEKEAGTGKLTILQIGQELSGEVQTQANKIFTELVNDGNSGITSTDTTGYRYWNVETIKSLGIEGVEQDCFVNVEKRSVISYKGLKHEGKMYYVLNQLPDNLYNVEYDNPNTGAPTFDVNYEKIGDSKWRINISNIQYAGYINKWKVQYKLEGKNYWNTTEDMSFVVNESGIYDIIIENGNIKSEQKKFLVSPINAPKLSEGMIPVKWKDNNWVICNQYDKEWYNYVDQANGVDGTSNWANVMLSDGKYYDKNSSNVDKTNKKEAQEGTVVAKSDLGSMFVWIPRYAYQIESGYNKSTAGKINISFLEGKNKYNKGDKISYSSENVLGTGKLVNASGEGNWNEHPAFTYGEDILEGIWAAKFEASNSNSKVRVIPGVRAWDKMTVGDAYKNCIDMNNTNNGSYYGINTNINIISSHLMKNSEWGAIAYLTQSSYGRNRNEVTVNNSSGYITGAAGNSVSAGMDIGTTNDYSSNQGIKASTTGNATGIYDMSSGGWERVAGYVNNGHANLTKYGKLLVESNIGRNKQVYEGITSGGSAATTGNDTKEKNYSKMISIYGDGIYETSSSYQGATSWNGDSSNTAYTAYPFITRGGAVDHRTEAGIFNFLYTTGNASDGATFRPVIVVF